jgi:hypothetical protein
MEDGMNDRDRKQLIVAFTEACAAGAISGPVDHDRFRQLVDRHLTVRIARDGAGQWRTAQ